MLAKEARLRTADDFRSTMRTGRKVTSANLVIYLKRVPRTAQARFGFVVAKTVGNAVTRNLVKRRLRNLARNQQITLDRGLDVVVRALPGASSLNWDSIAKEFEASLSKGFAKEIE
jgi:ribonuclease P protein component